MAHTPDIQILVGVLGGGSISGESGQLIKKQIETIIDSCSKSPKSALRLNINEAYFNGRLTNAIGHATHKIAPLKITVNAGYLQDQIRRSLQNMPPVQIPCNCKGGNNSGNNSGNSNNNRGGSGSNRGVREMVAMANLRRRQADASDFDKKSSVYQDMEAQHGRHNTRYELWKQSESRRTGQSEAAIDRMVENNERVIAAHDKLIEKERQHEDNLKRTSSSAIISYDKVADGVYRYYQKNADAIARNPDLFKRLTQLNDQLLTGTFTGTAKEANQEFLEIRRAIERTGSDVDTLGQKLTKTFKSKLYYAVLVGAAESARRAIRQLYTNVVELDDAMAQMKIVTGASTRALKEYTTGAAEAAKQTGRTMTEIMASSTEYARLGYSLEESLNLSETTAKLSNVAAVGTDEATSAMTAILKGYRLGAKDAELVGDMMTKVANEYAIDAGELGAALERGGASLAAANNTLAESMALMAAGNAAIQNAETVGTAFKTTSMRIRGTSIEELEEAGLATDGLIESTAKLQSQIKALSGVDIMLDSDTYKSTYQIMLEIAQVWDNISDINQAALLEALAGKRNSQVLMSVIQNLDDLKGAYAAATNAAGTMEKANAIAMDTITGKSKAVAAGWQELSDNLLDNRIVKVLMDITLWFIEMANQAVAMGNGVVGTFVGIAASLASLAVMLPPVLGGITKLRTSLAKLSAESSTATSITTLIKNLGKLKTAAIVAAVALVGTIAWASYKNYKAKNPTFETLQEQADEATTKLESMRSELSQTYKRIVELETLAQKGELNITDANELTMLQEKNRLLQLQIDLQKTAAENANKAARDKAQQNASDFFTTREDRWLVSDNSYGGEVVSNVTAAEFFYVQLDEYKKAKEAYEGALRAGSQEEADRFKEHMDVLNSALQATQTEMAELVPSLDAGSDEFKKLQMMADIYTMALGDAEQKSKLFADVYSRGEYADARKALDELGKKGILTHETLNELYKSNPAVKELVDYLIDLKLVDAENLSTLANQINSVGSAVSHLEIKDISTYLEDTESELKLLAQAQDDMDEIGVISSGTLKDLMDNYESLGGYLVQTSNGYKLTNGALNDHLALLKAEAKVKLQDAVNAASAYVGAIGDENIALEDQAEKLKEVLALTLSLADGNNVDSAYLRMYGTSNPSGVTKIEASVNQLAAIKNDIDNALAAYSSHSNLEETTKHSGSKSDPYKERIEKEIKIKQHQREMDKITDADYYEFLKEKIDDYSKYAEKYEEEIWDLKQEYFNGQRDLLDDWINDQQKAGERLADSGNLTGQIALQKEVLDRLQEAIDEAYEYGLDENSEYVQKLEDQMREASQAILDITKSAFDDFISYADDFNVWEDLDISKVSVLEQELKEIDKLLEAGVLSWKEYVKAYNETAKELYDTQKESIESIIDLTMEMIEKNAEDEVEALEKQKEAYRELIDAKKELLEKSKDEKDHERDIEKTVRELSKLQEKLNSLRLDDSQQAAAERAKLEEEIYQKTLELQEKQEDYAYESTIDYLDKIQKEKEDAIDEEIEDIEEGVDTWVEVYEEAIKMLDDDFEGLFDDLTKWMEKHRDSIDGPDSLMTAWKNVAKIKENYASTGIEEIYDGLGSNAIDPSTNSVGAVEAARSIVQRMYDNSVAAKGNPNWQALNAENHELRQEYEAATGQSLYYNKAAGTWHIGTDASGPLLYDLYKLPKYHSGGYVGSNGSINNSEVLSLLERGELVLTHEHQSKLKKIFESIYSMLTLVSPARMSGFSTTQGAGLNSEVVVNITHNGSMTDADAKRYGDIVGDTALQKLKSAFNKRGVR